MLKFFFNSSFIICWLPFFTLYLISPFCNDCINPYLFSVVFWIGYCNSAINPMIYALFSKDFRFAFKRIICKCFCSGQGMRQPSSRRGSDMSALRRDGTRTPSISPSAQAQSLGDDSDPITDDLHRWRSYAASISSSTSCGASAGGKLNINSSSMLNSNLGPLTDTKSGDNVNSESKNNHSGLMINSNGVGSSNGKSSVRASSVYDICHPLVM